jgi:hypothetical protein
LWTNAGHLANLPKHLFVAEQEQDLAEIKVEKLRLHGSNKKKRRDEMSRLKG